MQILCTLRFYPFICPHMTWRLVIQGFPFLNCTHLLTTCKVGRWFGLQLGYLKVFERLATDYSYSATTSVSLCPAAVTGCPTQNHHPLFPGSGISYNWTDTAAGSSQTLSCSGLRLCQEMAGVSGGMIIRRCSALAEWLSVDFSGCGLSVTTLQLCEASQVSRSIYCCMCWRGQVEVLTGASLSEPNTTSVTALCMHVYMLTCLLGPTTYCSHQF